MPIEISPERLPLCTRQRGNHPGQNTPYGHLFPSKNHWYYGVNKIRLPEIKHSIVTKSVFVF